MVQLDFAPMELIRLEIILLQRYCSSGANIIVELNEDLVFNKICLAPEE